ncbi:lysophosphatidic acid receptor 6 [Oncorhynchus tshawytscha]|uniref:G-protein coupled receptors family 1 profile domain-containing protein n=1 Tax=Oncorhynchus tshawytscha TaxID=74940 RepID=A0AAZ3PNU4_ONCTS|nr:lysophosphatidic acid receptor 6 [Oncorhynchus tshawytscha]
MRLKLNWKLHRLHQRMCTPENKETYFVLYSLELSRTSDCCFPQKRSHFFFVLTFINTPILQTLHHSSRKMYNSTLETDSISSLGLSQNNTSCFKSDGFKYTMYTSVFSLVFIVGLLFNMVAVYIFACTLKLRNETTTYMMNLVVSDLLFVLTLPFRIFYFINRDWPFGRVLCQLSVSLFYTNMYGSILFLTCITVDRFLAIVYPFRSQALRTKRNAKLACCAVWVLVLSGSLPTGFLLDTTSLRNENSNSSVNYCFENFSNNQWQSSLSKVVVFIETVGFLIPLLLNVFCSVSVLQTLRQPQAISRGGQLNKTKILRMIVVHLLIFCFCFIPYNVNLVFYALVRTKLLEGCTVESVVRTIYPITLCIAVTNCCFDPVIYYFTSETIQNSIKRKSMAVRNNKMSVRLQTDTLKSHSTMQNNLTTLREKVFHNESTV